MLFIAPVVSVALFATTTCTNNEFDQCGGSGFAGETCCPDYDECTIQNDFFSQCQPKDLCLTPQFGQCDGVDKDGNPLDPKKKCCPPSFHCTYQSQYFSQCSPDPPTGNCSASYAQCGGQDSDGNPWGTKPTEKSCCDAGYHCAVTNKYYSGCNPDPVCTNARYGQCGGQDTDGKPWTPANGHDSCCPSGFKCVYTSQYFSQCKLNTTATTIAIKPVAVDIKA